MSIAQKWHNKSHKKMQVLQILVYTSTRKSRESLKAESLVLLLSHLKHKKTWNNDRNNQQSLHKWVCWVCWRWKPTQVETVATSQDTHLLLHTSKLANHRLVPLIIGVVASLVTLTNERHGYNLVWVKHVVWPILRDLCLVYRYEDPWLVPMIGWVLQLWLWLL